MKNMDDIRRVTNRIKGLGAEAWITKITPYTKRGCGWSNYHAELEGLLVRLHRTERGGFLGPYKVYEVKISNRGTEVLSFNSDRGKYRKQARDIFEHIEKVCRTYEAEQERRRKTEGQKKLKRL